MIYVYYLHKHMCPSYASLGIHTNHNISLYIPQYPHYRYTFPPQNMSSQHFDHSSFHLAQQYTLPQGLFQ